MTFNFAAAIDQRPSGQTTQALLAAFGNPEGPGATASTQGGAWFNPAPSWVKQNIVKIPMSELPGFPRCPYGTLSGVSLHRLVAPVFKATWEELRYRSLTQHLRTFDGSVAYRHMGHNRSRPLSAHAFGIALDFDAAWNGYGVPLERMQLNREIARCFEECGWHWGGRWTGAYADGMHFQWTDPLQGVKVPEWQDAMAKRPTPTTLPDAAAPIPQVIVRDRAGKDIVTPYTEAKYHGVIFRREKGRVLLRPEGTPEWEL